MEESSVLFHTSGDLVPLDDSLFPPIHQRRGPQEVKIRKKWQFWVQISSLGTRRLSSHLREMQLHAFPPCAAELAGNATGSPNPESFSHKVQGPGLYFCAYYKSNFLTSTKYLNFLLQNRSSCHSNFPSGQSFALNNDFGPEHMGRCFLSEGSIPLSYLSLFFCS